MRGPRSVALHTRTEPVRRWVTATWEEQWIAICAVVLLLASDTKLVLKDRVSGAGSTVDVFILIEIGVYAAVGAYLVLRRRAWLRSPTEPHPLEGLMAALLVLVAISVLFSAVPAYSAVRAAQTIVLVLLARAAIGSGSVRWFRSFALLTLWSTSFLVLVGVILPTQKGSLQVDRFNWLATHPVVVGQFTALAACVGLALLLGVRMPGGVDPAIGPVPRRMGLAIGLPTVMCGAALLATHTRGSVVAGVIGAGVAVLLTIPRQLRPRLAMGATLAAVVATVLGASTITAWFTRGESADSLLTLNSRTDLWTLALTSTLRESPAIGHGVGASRSIFVEATGLGGGHNAVVNLFTDLGFLGLVVWGALIIWPALIVWRSMPVGLWRLDRIVWLVAFAVLVTNSLTYEGLGNPPSVAFTWLIMMAAAAVVVDRHVSPRLAERVTGPLGSPSPRNPHRRNDTVSNDTPTFAAQPGTGHPTLLQSISRHRRLVAAFAAGLMAVLGMAAFLSTPAALATGRFGLVFPPAGNMLLPVPTGESSLKRYVAERAQYAESDLVLESVAEAAGLSVDDVRRSLQVTPADQGNGLIFKAVEGAADRAVLIVTTAMDSYRANTGSEVTRRAEAAAAGQEASGQPGAEITRADAEAFGDGVDSVVMPTVASTETRGLPWRELLIGLLAGCAFGSVIAWFIEDVRYRRRRSA